MLTAVLANNRDACAAAPRPKMVEVAILTLLRASSGTAKTAMEQGQLQGLGAAVRGEIVWVSSRVRGEKMAELLGVQELPVLLGSEELAKSILRKSYRQDHRRNP